MTEETRDTIFAVLFMALAFGFGTSVGHLGADWSWRRQIAGHHAAEFYIDKNNYRQWRWVDCKHE